MATIAEIVEAVQTARDAGAKEIALLKCTSAYPADAAEMNLRTRPALASCFQFPLGLSDHSMGVAAPVAAVTLGASIIEKHLTLSRSAKGPDSTFSLEPQEFKMMVNAVSTTERALGDVHFGAIGHEVASLAFRRSLFVVEDMKQRDLFSGRTVRAIRPSHGLQRATCPRFWAAGQRATSSGVRPSAGIW